MSGQLTGWRRVATGHDRGRKDLFSAVAFAATTSFLSDLTLSGVKQPSQVSRHRSTINREAPEWILSAVVSQTRVGVDKRLAKHAGVD